MRPEGSARNGTDRTAGLDARARKRGNVKMRENRARMRMWAYVEGLELYIAYRSAVGFREFVALCLGSSDGLATGAVKIRVKDPVVAANFLGWLAAFGSNRPRAELRLPAGTVTEPVRSKWEESLGRTGVPVAVATPSPRKGGRRSRSTAGDLDLGQITIALDDRLTCQKILACTDSLRQDLDRVN